MFIERPPLLMRMLCSYGVFRMPNEERSVYLTFDDGPIPESTPWILDTLDRYGVKATFFMVGDNVRKYPGLYQDIINRGHKAGNHTMHHLQGLKTPTEAYLEDVRRASELIDSRLFRPPHGFMRRSQAKMLKGDYKIIMFDLVTRDYSCSLTAEDIVRNVKRYARRGSVIVFHDSLKSIERNRKALPESLEWLLGEGYDFKTIS